MRTNVEYGRLYAPAADPTKPNERKVIHLETSMDHIVADPEGKQLNDFLGKQVYVSQEPPGKDVTDAIWVEITGTRILNS